MVYKKLKDISNIITGLSEVKNRLETGHSYKCILPSYLDENDVVTTFDEIEKEQKINEKYLIRKNDILIKRISPSFTNVVNCDLEKTYTTSNVMIIRPNENVDSQYIASILEMQGLAMLNHFTSKGVIMKSVSKKELGEVIIPMIPLEVQYKYGKLRVLNNKKSVLENKLQVEKKRLMKAILQELTMEGK